MKDTRTIEHKRFDRKQEIVGTIMGIYMRNNRMKALPIDDKTLNEIADHLAPFYITLSQAEYEDFRDTVKYLAKPGRALPFHRKSLKNVLDKFKVFC